MKGIQYRVSSPKTTIKSSVDARNYLFNIYFTWLYIKSIQIVFTPLTNQKVFFDNIIFSEQTDNSPSLVISPLVQNIENQGNDVLIYSQTTKGAIIEMKKFKNEDKKKNVNDYFIESRNFTTEEEKNLNDAIKHIVSTEGVKTGKRLKL